MPARGMDDLLTCPRCDMAARLARENDLIAEAETAAEWARQAGAGGAADVLVGLVREAVEISQGLAQDLLDMQMEVA